MANQIPENLPIIEVPPELRGLSDEEILALHPYDPEKRDRFRPSKKERAARKLAREQARMRQIAEQYKNRNNFSRYASRPMPKMSDFDGTHPVQAQHKPMQHKKALFVPGQAKAPPSPPIVNTAKSASAPLPPRQSSGRVLVGSFGGASFGTAKTQIISEAELAKQAAIKKAKAEALARANLLKMQQQAAMENPTNALNALFKADSPLSSGAAISPEIPVKRKRGRPRKNPLPENL